MLKTALVVRHRGSDKKLRDEKVGYNNHAAQCNRTMNDTCHYHKENEPEWEALFMFLAPDFYAQDCLDGVSVCDEQ